MRVLRIARLHRSVVGFLAQDPSAWPDRSHDVLKSGHEIVDVGKHSAAVGKVEAAWRDRSLHDVVGDDLTATAREIIEEPWISVCRKNESLWTAAFRKRPGNGAGTGADLHASPPSLHADRVEASDRCWIVHLLK